MKKRTVKKIVVAVVSSLLLLLIVLCVHIYIVTRPAPPTASTKVMARIDFKQAINKEDAQKITAWLYQEDGVDHVLCNPDTRIAVFTYYPVKTNADKVVADLQSAYDYKMARYIPSRKELEGSCPVAANSLSYKIYNSLTSIFNKN